MDSLEDADSGNVGRPPLGAGASRPTHSSTPISLRAELERVHAELVARTRACDESEARFHALIDGNVDGIMVIGPDGSIRFANAAAADLFGIPRDRLVGNIFGHPLVVGLTSEIDALPRGGSPVVMEMRVVDAQWEGAPASIAILRDVTDRRRAEDSARRAILAEALSAAARQTSKRFRFLADASEALASSLSRGTTMETLARLCVAELADWVVVYLDGDADQRRLEIVHRDPQRAGAAGSLRDLSLERGASDPIIAALDAAEFRASPSVSRSEMDLMLGDDRTRALIEELGIASYILLPIVAHDRRLGALGLVRSSPENAYQEEDVALAQALAGRAALAFDNARLYQSARAADRAKSDLIAVISHDLRTPLHSIIGYADLLDMGVPEPIGDRSREWVRRIRSSAEHQVHLIDQLLTFSRADAGAIELRPQAIELAELLREVHDMVSPLAERAGLALHLEDGADVRVEADPDALRQVVLNLATNAVKYTERGEVRLAAVREVEAALVRISDTGIGIAAENITRIFDPFWQAAPGKQGAGLGLSIVQRLARSLGAEIEVASEVGVGSVFTLRMPVLV